MLRRALVFAASAQLLACGAPIRRAVDTTEAAAELQQVTRSETNEFDPAVSPDGTAIAYRVATSPDSMPRVAVMGLKDVGSPQPPHVAYVTSGPLGAEPAWMPDGSGLVYVANDRGSPRLVEALGPNPQNAASVGEAGDPFLFAAWPAISPDGKTIAASLLRVREFQSGWRTSQRLDAAIGISDLFGGGLTVLGAGTDPVWSPRGRHLAFARAVDGHPHVFVTNADGSSARQITEGPDDDERPSWSPDGQHIVFCSAHAGEPGQRHANLFVVRPDGSGLVQLTEGDRVACRPAWARDGFVYFHANVADRFHIWRIRPLDPGAEAPLTGP